MTYLASVLSDSDYIRAEDGQVLMLEDKASQKGLIAIHRSYASYMNNSDCEPDQLPIKYLLYGVLCGCT